MSKMHEHTNTFLLKQLELIDDSIAEYESTAEYCKRQISLRDKDINDCMIKIDGLVETRACLRKLLEGNEDKENA